VTAAFRGPVVFDPTHHDVSSFDSGEPALDNWLQTRAGKNAASGASRTWVAVDETDRVIAFYASATGAVLRAEVTSRVRRTQPEPIPTVVLARLAVDRRAQGAGLGAALLKHFLAKTLEVAEVVGVRLIVVHAKSETAVGFYSRYGFVASPVDDFVLHLLVQDLRSSLS
jgi:GNAT superfamily N-acetyltransferase